MQVTYLAKAQALGVEALTNIVVNEIKPQKDRIDVLGNLNGQKLILRSQEVILAAGTVETPRILNRSKLTNGNFELNFHPMLRAVGMQSEYINDGDLFPSWQAWTPDLKFKYGYSVSTYPYLAATLQSLGEEKIFTNSELSKMAAYFSSFSLTDSKAKLVKIGSALIPIVIWGDKDKDSMRSSMYQLRSILVSGDAIEVWPKNGLSPVTTVHLFGSLPLERSREVNSAGQLKKEPRIRISDGSLMPHAPWGNPQGPIMVLCELMARRNLEK
jgi:hypothetical protein